MDRRIAAAGAVFLLLSAVVVVQILDPQFGERSPPEVDFSEPPNEVAADAAEQFEYVDYAYRVEVAKDESDEWRQFGVTHVDHSNRTYQSMGPEGEKETVIYGTTAAAFVRPTIDEDWIVIARPGVVYPVSYLTQPIYVERIRAEEARVLSENSSTATIHFDINPLKIDDNLPGNSIVIVNKKTGMVESVRVAHDTPHSGARYLRLQVIKTGTTVERPKAIGFSLSEVCLDLLRGPLFRVL